MFQRIISPFLLLASIYLSSCGGKKSNGTAEKADSTTASTNTAAQINSNEVAADTTLLPHQSLIEKGFAQWMQSFKNFRIDSFHQVDKREFQESDYGDMDAASMSLFYSLYKPSLSFSADSSQFIDLYSNGISLEKRGKKIVAIGDVDQSVTLCNIKAKNWKSILSFGPSAGMEEALWVSPTSFLLAGTMQNDDGKNQAVLILGNTETKSFRWFEANTIREESSAYKPSSLSKLKIDEWE